MKKRTLTLLAALFLVPAFGQENLEEKVFIRPHVARIAQAMAIQAGKDVASLEKNQLLNLVTVNVGSNIPSHGLKVSVNGSEDISLQGYIADLAKKMEVNSQMMIAAPASYHVVFTNGQRSDDEIYQHIDQVLARIGKSYDDAFISSALNELNGVSRATFVRREENLFLVTDARALRVGEKIWRKTPEGVVQDYYHSEEEYLVAIRNAKLSCEEVIRPSFFGHIKWKQYNNSLTDKNETLGAAYMENNPVTLYHVVKKAS